MSQHRRQKNGTGSSARGCAQVVQSIGSSRREACLNRSMIIGEDVSSRCESGPVERMGLCKELSRPVKVVASQGGVI